MKKFVRWLLGDKGKRAIRPDQLRYKRDIYKRAVKHLRSMLHMWYSSRFRKENLVKLEMEIPDIASDLDDVSDPAKDIAAYFSKLSRYFHHQAELMENSDSEIDDIDISPLEYEIKLFKRRLDDDLNGVRYTKFDPIWEKCPRCLIYIKRFEDCECGMTFRMRMMQKTAKRHEKLDGK